MSSRPAHLNMSNDKVGVTYHALFQFWKRFESVVVVRVRGPSSSSVVSSHNSEPL